MKRLFWHWFISTLALMAGAAALSQGVHIVHWYDALWIAPLLGLVNMLVGVLTGIITFIGLPINLITLGCFGFAVSLVLYAGAIYYMGTHMQSFKVDGFGWAAGLAVIMALVSSLLNMLFGDEKRRDRR